MESLQKKIQATEREPLCYLIAAGNLIVYVLIFIKKKQREWGRRETCIFCWKALLGRQTRRVDVADVLVKSEIYVKNVST